MHLDLIDLLRDARSRNGSDLHLCASLPPAARVEGVLVPLTETELSPAQCRDLVHAVLTDTERARLERDWELDFALQVEGVGRFRGNAHYVRGNVECAMRFVPEAIPDLTALGHGEPVEQLCALRQGLIVVTGMAGMGKTTTLASMTRRILKTRPGIVLIVEDPIEYVQRHSYGVVKQRQLGLDTHSYGSAIKAGLRQDVDVIVIAEMRDLDSIRAALTAAETGHLVITTLHTPDAVGTLDRIVDVFPPDQQQQIITQLAGALAGVICQKLVPRIDAPGRAMVSEILLRNDAVQACIRQHKFHQIQGLIQIGGGQGMHTFDDSLRHLLFNGHIDLETALEYARDEESIKSDFQELLRSRSRR